MYLPLTLSCSLEMGLSDWGNGDWDADVGSSIASAQDSGSVATDCGGVAVGGGGGGGWCCHACSRGKLSSGDLHSTASFWK